MEPIDLDAQLKRALSRLAESAPIRQPPLQDLLARGRRQQQRSRLALVFSPLAAILLFPAVTAFPVFAGAQNLAQWWTGRQLEQASSVWNSISPVGSLLAIQFHCDPAMVNNLLAQGVSPQEVALRAEVANASGLSLWKITALRGQGLGWGRIIEELGLERKVIPGQLAPLTPSNPENIQIPGVTPSTGKTSSSPQSFFSQTVTGLPTPSPTSDAGLPIDPSPSAGNGSSDHPSTPPATPGSPSEPPSESQGTPSSPGEPPTTTPSGQGGTPTTTPSGPGGPSTSTPTSPGGPPTSTPTGPGGPPTSTPSGPGGPPTAPPSPSPSPPGPGPGPNPSPGSKPKP